MRVLPQTGQVPRLRDGMRQSALPRLFLDMNKSHLH